ncbi:predicted protein [Nematostella vectensis]|uniref:Uncharacterized protein n=1 Tax=Nematostella vectensis TaxID=45351 RepID=A7RV61_NEMVE|nr:predicted protein [Nematostella vectensis]|eukprot:XP_001636757.1 predicted protein [Nematostella vectensis]
MTCLQVLPKNSYVVQGMQSETLLNQGIEAVRQPISGILGKPPLKENAVILFREQNTLLLDSLNPLIDKTDLEWIVFSYEKNWAKEFWPIYEEALRNHALFKPKLKKIIIKKQLKNNYSNGKNMKKELGRFDKPLDSNYLAGTMMCSSFCKPVEKPSQDSMSPAEEKCNPTELATVFLALRDELPLFFQNGHGYSLYHENVKFINALTRTTTNGLSSYKALLAAMRCIGQLYMSDVSIEILRITEDPKDCDVKVRWRICGVPRYNSLINRRIDDKIRYVDGFSIFEVGRDGLIHCHRLMKLMPSKSPETDDPLWVVRPATIFGLLPKAPGMLARHRVKDAGGTTVAHS